MRFKKSLARRRMLKAALVGAAIRPSTPAHAEPIPSLREAAVRSGLLFGSSSDTEIARAPFVYAELFKAQCDLLAPQLAWSSVSPHRSEHDPAHEDPNISFARANHLRLTGAHLLWHEGIPPWFGEVKTQPEALQTINRHIVSMVARYHPIIYSWNVVNEAIEPKDGRADGLRISTFLQLLGPDYIEMAFRTARQAAPDTTLVYNDYGFEANTSDSKRRRYALLKLLDRLLAGKVPIDAVGLQSHLKLDGSSLDSGAYRSFLREIAGRGLGIMITELDVLNLAPAADVAELDAATASRYSEFLTTALDEPAVTTIVTWGLSDRYTWLIPSRDRHYRRRDGQPNRPLPFDASFQPKPAFFATLSALQHAPPRRAA